MENELLQDQDECPINTLMDIISAKWTVEIMRELALQPTRTRKFLLHIPGLSMKTLCRRLQILESAQLINRHEYPGKSLKVEYSLTDHGRQLCTIFEQVKQLESIIAGRECSSCHCSIEKSCMESPATFNCMHRREKKAKLTIMPAESSEADSAAQLMI